MAVARLSNLKDKIGKLKDNMNLRTIRLYRTGTWFSRKTLYSSKQSAQAFLIFEQQQENSMYRNNKASRDGRENKRNRSYWVSCKGHSEFTRICRRSIRARAKQALREGLEPLPKDPKHWEYYD